MAASIHVKNDPKSFCFSVRSVMHKHLEKLGEVTFDKIFNQKIGEWEKVS